MCHVQRTSGYTHLRRVGALIGACSMALAQPVVDEDARVLEAARRANLQKVQRIRTLIIEERLETELKELPADEVRYRQRRLEPLLAYLQTAAGAGSMGSDEADRFQRQQELLNSEAAAADEALLVRRINRRVALRRVTSIDFRTGRARLEDRDLRDLARIAADHGLGPPLLWSVDRSCTRILTREGPETRLIPQADRLALVNPWGERLVDHRELRKLGIVPSWVFDGHHRIECRRGESAEAGRDVLIRAFDGGAGTPRFEVVLRPELDYAMIELRGRDERGHLVERFACSDYREIDGVHVPFATELRLTRPELADNYVETRTVESMRINPALPGPTELYSIPRGYRVQDMRLARK